MRLGRYAFLGLVLVLAMSATPPMSAASAADDLPGATSEVDLTPVDGGSTSPAMEGSFDMVGIEWSGSDDLEVRFRRGTTWTAWETVVFDEHGDRSEEADTGDGNRTTELTWVGDADAYRLRSGGEGTAVVNTQSITDRPPPEQLQEAEQQFTTGTPTIIPRTAWDPTDRCHPRVDPTRIQPTHLIVHHTSASASANEYSSGEVADIILSYCLYHRDGRGWDDLAYNFMIDRFGRIWEGRFGGIDQGIRGGSSRGANYASVGAAFIGAHDIGTPTAAAQTALVELLTWLSETHNLDPDGTSRFVSEGSSKLDPGEAIDLPVISGHRDTQATACPGRYGYAILPSIRARVAAAAAPYEPYDQYSAVGVGDFDGNGTLDASAFRPSDGVWSVTTDLAGTAKTAEWADFRTNSGWSAQVVGDFTGDGRDDIANFHPWNGTWWVSRSTGSGFVTTRWADFRTNSGWTAQVVGDFTGDGRDDIANFHPSNGTWWVSRSTGSGFVTTRWADLWPNSGWTAQVVGDFTGDDKDDIASFQDGDGAWWVSRSKGGAFATTRAAIGPILDKHVWMAVHDATGDGVDDLLVTDRVAGRWDIIGQDPTIGAGYQIHRADLLVPEQGARAAFDTRRRTWMLLDARGSLVTTSSVAGLD